MEWCLERGVVLHEKVLSADCIFKIRDMNIQRQGGGKEGGRERKEKEETKEGEEEGKEKGRELG